MTIFFRLVEVDVDDKSTELRALVSSVSDISETRIFDVDPLAFAEVAASPFSYWVPAGVRAAFRHPRLEQPERTAKQGLSTTDDFRFVRLWWEIASTDTGLRWFSFAKGGAFSLGYAPIHLVVNWFDGGHEIYAFTGITKGTSSAPMRSPHFYFRAGLTWPLRTQSGFGLRAMPKHCVFGHKGPGCFVADDPADDLLALLGIGMSTAFRYLVELQTAFGAYEVGVIQRTPVPLFTENDTAVLATLAHRAWSLKRVLDTSSETSHAFLLPPGLNEKLTGLEWSAAERELGLIQRQIDEAAFSLYCIGPEDRAAIEASSKRPAACNDAAEGPSDDEGDDSCADDAPIGAAADATFSWLVGVVFGRYDPRFATGERAIPPEPEPFDPLPSRSPTMWPEADEPAQRPDILVDDESHSDDLAARVRSAAEQVHSELSQNVRAWLAKDFFPLHVKMYSKSRRKAPIYWQLATPSASYSVWLYIHAFNKDTLFRVQNDYAAPKLAHEERRLESLTKELREKATAAQRKELTGQESIVDELRTFLEEVKRIAPLWNPNLDDGVIINFAPLWRLVPQHKPWQKELKATWDALCEGKYDWAHLAMHLWPERVVPKCAEDRSLAIAHGLEDVFWVEGTDGKWIARKAPTRPIDELVRERTSPAVKAALKNLLEAPVAQGGGGRSRGGRSRAAVSADAGGSR